MPESNSTVPKLPPIPDEASTPEDVATLYSWANLHGAKYRDFSASRAQAREEARVRAEEAAAAERRRQEEEAERIRQEEAQAAARLAAEAAEAARQAEADRLAEIARQAEIERQAVLAAQEAQRQALQQRGWQSSPGFQALGEAPAPAHEFQVERLDPVPNFGIEPLLDAGNRYAIESEMRPFSKGVVNPDPNPVQDWAAQNRAIQDRAIQDRAAYDRAAHDKAVQDRAVQDRAVQDRAVQDQARAADQAYLSRRPRAFANPGPNPDLHAGLSQPAGGNVADQTPARSNSGYPGSFGMQQSGPAVTNPAWLNPGQPNQPNSGHAAQPFVRTSPYAYPQANPSAAGLYPEDDSPLFAASPAQAARPPQDSYMQSPWHPGHQFNQFDQLDQADQLDQRDERELREQPFRPAWLAPEMPAQRSSQPAAQPIMPAANANISAPTQTQTQAHAQRYVPMYAQTLGQTPYVAQNSGQGPGPRPDPCPGPGPNPSQNPGPADDTLAGSRDRIANRWFALKSVFDPQSAPEPAPVPPPARVPVLAVFSLAGGVGKTSLVASLGRALSSRGERVLLVDTAAYGLLPFFFGARDQRPGQLRTFNPPGVSVEAPIQLVTLDPEAQLADPQNPDPNQASAERGPDWLAQEVTRLSRAANRILIDLPTASGSTTRRVLRLAPVVLVPVVPDMNSVVSVGAIEAFFRHSGNVGGKQIMPYYVLNQFDYSLPLHLDVREILREQIGDRLLPFALRRSPAVSEALAEGMTVMDYAPSAAAAEDYVSLAGWVRGLSAPATQSYRGVRWSER
jgi:cellulose synthase operon protein YhjQ